MREQSIGAAIGVRLERILQTSALTVLLALSAQAAWAGAQIASVTGRVELGHGAPPVWQSAEAGMPIAAGDLVRTGRDGRAEVRLPAGSVRLYPNSLLRVPIETEHVELERGSSLFDILHRAGGQHFEVQTPDIVVSVKGTRFSLDLSHEELAVAVFRGTVGVRTPGAENTLETLVREGFAARGGRGRAFELEVGPKADPWQSWKNSGVLPDLGGRHARMLRDPERLGEARNAVLRATNAEVIERAAQRNPVLAHKLAEIRAGKKANEDVSGAERGDHPHRGAPHLETLPPLPAAPAAVAPDNESVGGLGSDLQRLTGRRLQREHENDVEPEDLIDQASIQIVPEALHATPANSNGGGNNTAGGSGGAAGGSSGVGALSVSDLQQLGIDPTAPIPLGSIMKQQWGVPIEQLFQAFQASVLDLMTNHASEIQNGGAAAWPGVLEQSLVDIGGLTPKDAAQLAQTLRAQAKSP